MLPNYALGALLRDFDGSRGAPATVELLAAAGTAVGSREPSAPPLARDGCGKSKQPPGSLHRDTVAVQDIHVRRLMDLEVPAGLAKLVCEEDQRIALRVFLLDNSGSTAHPDGRRLVWKESLASFQQCTRWEEVTSMALEHARWNSVVGTPAEFILLNPPVVGTAIEEGFDCIRVDQTRGDVSVQILQLQELLLRTQPGGATPLTHSLQKIKNRISLEARDIARRGQKVVLVIATDGLPSGLRGESGREEMLRFGEQLRRMSAELPIHQVVRLCTNEDSIVDFYSSLDEELEVDLEVIDDMQGEAEEIWKVGNRWLVYSPVVHRLREGGTFLKVLDLLDERRLEPVEVLLVCQLILRQDPDDALLPSDPRAFCTAVRHILPALPRVLCPMSLKLVPPVRLEELEWAVLPRAPLYRRCAAALCACLRSSGSPFIATTSTAKYDRLQDASASASPVTIGATTRTWQSSK